MLQSDWCRATLLQSPDPAQAHQTGYSRPSFVAAYTASARRETISLRMRLPTWNFTVV